MTTPPDPHEPSGDTTNVPPREPITPPRLRRGERMAEPGDEGDVFYVPGRGYMVEEWYADH